MNYSLIDETMRQFLAAHRMATHRYFRGCGLFNGHPPILFLLSRQPGMTVKDLSEELQVSPAAVCTSLKRMESAGLIRRETDAADRRMTRFFLTDAGQETNDRCLAGRDYLTARQTEGLSEQEIDLLLSLLRRMTDNLQAVQERLPGEEENKEEIV